MTRLTRKLPSTTALVVLLAAGLLAFGAAAAYASGSSCNSGSCEDINGAGLTITSTDTYASSPHCNQTLATEQWDQKGYMAIWEVGPYHQSGCSNAAMPLSGKAAVNGCSCSGSASVAGNTTAYGQSYYSSAWQGIASVGIHS
jgi:hypothetical protein